MDAISRPLAGFIRNSFEPNQRKEEISRSVNLAQMVKVAAMVVALAAIFLFTSFPSLTTLFILLPLLYALYEFHTVAANFEKNLYVEDFLTTYITPQSQVNRLTERAPLSRAICNLALNF